MKLRKLSVLFLTVLAMSTAANGIALAANHSDTGYSFTVGPGYGARTEYREKTDSSGVYVYSLSGPRQTYFYVLNPSGTIKNSGEGVGITYPGNKYRIHTHIWEDRYTDGNVGPTRCALASIDNPFPGQSTGVWSPDSVGSYPFCN